MQMALGVRATKRAKLVADGVAHKAWVESVLDQHTRQRPIIADLRNRYSNILSRCNNPGHSAYKYYGGRGIQVNFESCDEFVDYVIDVLQIDPRGLDIDRIDNDGNYEPGNIRFVTHKENLQNKGTYRKRAKV